MGIITPKTKLIKEVFGSIYTFNSTGNFLKTHVSTNDIFKQFRDTKREILK